MPDLAPLFLEFSEAPLVSISDAQRRPLAEANWLGTVHHGLPVDLFCFRERHEGYLAFLGRISPEKQVDHAIRIAGEVGMPLKIAAKVAKEDREYFECRIEPLLDSSFVEFVGEIGESEKNDFLGGACALLFPIDWPEPFGLVMIEAMACGTPVVAYRHGSVPEIIEDGVNGYVVSNIREALDAVRLTRDFDRRRCRETFEKRFSDRRMVDDYMELYQSLLKVETGRMRVA
jgi:glycosyltransferase involved in cell wall biosynthesis